MKCSGCPNDCAAAGARSDLAIIGLWRDDLRIDQTAVRQYVDEGLDLFQEVLRRCPTWALGWDEKSRELTLNAEDCVHCMACINRMPKALRVGKVRGAALMIGGKAPVVKGAMLGWVLVPFMEMKPPYTELIELLDEDLRLLGRKRQKPRTRRRTDRPRGIGHLPGGDRAEAGAADGPRPAGQPLSFLASRGGEATWLKRISARPTIGR